MIEILVEMVLFLVSNIKSNYPDWVLKYKRKGTATHKIGENFYIYEVSRAEDKKLGRARKVTESYLGVITKNGLKIDRLQDTGGWRQE